MVAHRRIRVRIFSRDRPWWVRLLEGVAIALGRAEELTSKLKPPRAFPNDTKEGWRSREILFGLSVAVPSSERMSGDVAGQFSKP